MGMGKNVPSRTLGHANGETKKRENEAQLFQTQTTNGRDARVKRAIRSVRVVDLLHTRNTSDGSNRNRGYFIANGSPAPGKD